MVGEQLTETNVPEALHPHWVGLQSFPRDAFPVARRGNRAERTTTQQIRLQPKREAFYYASIRFLAGSLSGRLACRRAGSKLAFS